MCPRNQSSEMCGRSIILSSLTLLLSGILLQSVPEVVSEKSDENTHNNSISARERFTLPQLFNFDHFQKIFNKRYASTAERIVRAKLYLGRKIRAFISMIGYKNGTSNSYLGINQLSDRTLEEVKKTVMELESFSADSNKGLVLLGADRTGRGGNKDDFEGSRPDSDRQIKSTIEYDCDRAKQDSAAPKIEQVEYTEVDPVRLKENENFLNKMFRLFKMPPFKKPKSQPPIDEIHIDHRDCLFEPREQKECGSCYAFSVIALYEWAYCKATGSKMAFSEQYPLDCGSKLNMHGCTSGQPRAVRSFILKNGLQRLENYPYVARDQECLYKSTESLASNSFARIYDEGMELLSRTEIEKKLQVSPVVMAIMIEIGLFHEYSGGVASGGKCYGKNKGAHAMLLVGSGQEDGEDYWLLRNSLGPKWGVNGHYKLSKKSDCIIDNHGLVVYFPEVPLVELLADNGKPDAR